MNGKSFPVSDGSLVARKKNSSSDRFLDMQAGGPSYAVELGRKDSLTSTAESVAGKLPQPTFGLDQLSHLFASHGLTQTDLIALSGSDLVVSLTNSFFPPKLF